MGLTQGDPFAEWGDPQAPTKVVGYVPDAPCHNLCVGFLVSKALTSPSELHVKLVRMFTPEGQQLMMQEGRQICATYEINGKNSFTTTNPDGSIRQVLFKMSPGGTYTADDLRVAVEQAIEAAKSGSQSKQEGNP